MRFVPAIIIGLALILAPAVFVGLSYLLSNKLPDAEYTLRRAASLPGADSRVRQNLALVLGVQGKFDEAVEVATAELDPRQAQANIAYLRNMMQARQRG